MKRLKSTLATILLVSAGAATIGLGAVMAVAALLIGLVIAGAARLVVGAQAGDPDPVRADADIVDAETAPAS